MDVCEVCGTLFEEGADHCRHCGADRGSHSVKREMRELCPTYTGDDQDREEIDRMVKPLFEPAWGKEQWYERTEGKAKRRRRR